MSSSLESLAAAFASLAQALQTQDVAAYRALVVQDVVPQDTLFLQNARRLHDAKYTLRLKRATLEGDAAEVDFDVVDSGAATVDTGRVVFTREADGWRVRGL